MEFYEISGDLADLEAAVPGSLVASLGRKDLEFEPRGAGPAVKLVLPPTAGYDAA